MMRVLTLSILLSLVWSFQAAADSFRRSVNFEWDPIEGARSYEVELKLQKNEKSDKAKVFNFKVKEAAWTGKLAPTKYLMRLRSRDGRGVPGDWSEPSDFNVGLETVQMKFPKSQEKFRTKTADTASVPFAWSAAGGATGYHLEINSDDGSFKLSQDMKDTKFTTKLPVARKYIWKVSAFSADGINSEAVSTADFSLLGSNLPLAKIEKPESGFVREIKWEPTPNAENYDVYILRLSSQKKWEKFKSYENYKDTVVPFEESWSGGKYQVLVRGKGNLRAPSPLAKQTFDVVRGNRSPAAEYTALVRKSIDRVTGWYGIASYLVTQIEYHSAVQDYNSKIDYSTVGGTGRLGAGWLSPDTPWGFVGIVDMSGFSLEGKTNTFASAEMNGIYRIAMNDRTDLRFQGGVFYKEVPATIREKNNAGAIILSQDSAIKAAGPHVGAEYWYSLTPKLGFQLNAHLYLSAVKMSTPNGQDLSPSISNQIGVLGSYRITPTLTGLLGYARREEKLSYKKDPNAVFQNSSDDNTTDISGNYLNFFAEWSF
jgi:hypothetical protein